MPNTMELLNRALAVKRAARWCEEMHLDPSAITQARKRGKLSGPMSAYMALTLGENPVMWAGVASIENDDHYSPELKARMLAEFETSAAL